MWFILFNLQVWVNRFQLPLHFFPCYGPNWIFFFGVFVNFIFNFERNSHFLCIHYQCLLMWEVQIFCYCHNITYFDTFHFPLCIILTVWYITISVLQPVGKLVFQESVCVLKMASIFLPATQNIIQTILCNNEIITAW